MENTVPIQGPEPAQDPIEQLKVASALLALDNETMPSGAAQQHQELQGVLAHLTNGDTPQGKDAYERLKTVFKWHAALGQVANLIDWIEQTNLLKADEQDITNAKEGLKVFQHRLMKMPEVKQWLDEAAAQLTPDAVRQRDIMLMKKAWLEAAGLDEKLVGELTRAFDASYRSWKEARPKNDFAAWLPHLEEVVKLTREKAEILGRELGVTPYQALLESYNPGLKNERVNEIFGALGKTLPALIQDVTKKQAESPQPIPLPGVPVEVQRKVMQRVMKEVVARMGLDASHIRLDESAHPFSTGRWDDMRVTTRYGEDNMLRALMGVIHEAGHALYSFGLPRDLKYQPVGEAQGMFVHESQSLFWEKQVACSPEFMRYLAPIITGELQKNGVTVDPKVWSPENLYKLATKVQPDLIRTEADEVTYPAHIILRHDLEQKLIEGSLKPKDLPDAWNKGMKDLLDVTVPDDKSGCMQDIHWTDGSFGYFPAYSFGALGAAQLMQGLRGEMPQVGAYIANGDFTKIREWLVEHVHRHGSVYGGEELIANATGKPFSEEAWIDHIEQRYLGKVQGVTRH